MIETKQYLGDSVYVDLDKYGQVVLTTENDYGASNTVVMEPTVVQNFDRWRKWIEEINQPEPSNIEA